jgi:hypothetical protein
VGVVTYTFPFQTLDVISKLSSFQESRLERRHPKFKPRWYLLGFLALTPHEKIVHYLCLDWLGKLQSSQCKIVYMLIFETISQGLYDIAMIERRRNELALKLSVRISKTGILGIGNDDQSSLLASRGLGNTSLEGRGSRLCVHAN